MRCRLRSVVAISVRDILSAVCIIKSATDYLFLLFIRSHFPSQTNLSAVVYFSRSVSLITPVYPSLPSLPLHTPTPPLSYSHSPQRRGDCDHAAINELRGKLLLALQLFGRGNTIDIPMLLLLETVSHEVPARVREGNAAREGD